MGTFHTRIQCHIPEDWDPQDVSCLFDMTWSQDRLRQHHMAAEAIKGSAYVTKLNCWFQTFAMFWLLYVFFWVIPRCLNFMCWHFGRHCLFDLHRWVGVKYDCIEKSWSNLYRERFGSKIAWSSRKEDDRLGVVQITETGHGGCEGDRACVVVRSYFTPTCLWRRNRQCSETSAY